MFPWFLEKNNALYHKDGSKQIADDALVAMTLMIAESKETWSLSQHGYGSKLGSKPQWQPYAGIGSSQGMYS